MSHMGPLALGDAEGTGQMSLMGQIIGISSAKPSKMPGEELDHLELRKSRLRQILASVSGGCRSQV